MFWRSGLEKFFVLFWEDIPAHSVEPQEIMHTQKSKYLKVEVLNKLIY